MMAYMLDHCIDSKEYTSYYIIHHIFTFAEVEQWAHQTGGKVAEQKTRPMEGRVAGKKAR